MIMNDESNLRIAESTEILKADQANKLVYGSHNMSLNERRLLMLAICKLSLDMSTFPIIYIRVEDLKNYLAIEDEAFHSRLRQVCRRLMGRLVEIESDDGDIWIAHQWVSRCKIEKGKGMVEIRIHEDLEPYLLGLKTHFQSIEYDHIAKISKSHALRIYEIIHHKYHERGVPQNEFDLSLTDFRKMLDLGKKYPKWKDLRVRILDPAVEELDKATPLKFRYEGLKKWGRAIDTIRFTVIPNPNFSADKLPPVNMQMLMELKEATTHEDAKKVIFGHLTKYLNKDSWYREYEQWIHQGRTPEQIQRCIEWAVKQIEQQSQTPDPIKEPIGFIRWAVREKKGV